MRLKCVKGAKERVEASSYLVLEPSKYKGKYFYQVDTYYPSSQICSVCNHKDSKYKDLNEREYVCKSCNSVIDRDLNASINIMFEGLKLYIKDNFA